MMFFDLPPGSGVLTVDTPMVEGHAVPVEMPSAHIGENAPPPPPPPPTH